MIEALKDAPPWFVGLLVAGLASFAGWSLSRSIGKLDKTIDRFQLLFDKVFEKHDDHEHRLSKLEGKCDSNHGSKK